MADGEPQFGLSYKVSQQLLQSTNTPKTDSAHNYDKIHHTCSRTNSAPCDTAWWDLPEWVGTRHLPLQRVSGMREKKLGEI